MLILHTGDIHMGDFPGPIKDGKNARRRDIIRCLDKIATAAADRHPNISIIAGDLFHRSRVWVDTGLEDIDDVINHLLRPLCDHSEQVVALYGTSNHDGEKAFELLKNTIGNELPNLHIYTAPGIDQLETEEGPVQILALPGFDRGRLRLFCPGADKETENRNATALINDILLGLSTELDKSVPSILVAHYTVAGSEADNGSTFLAGQDVVVLPSSIDSTGVDLACFGHIHRPQRLSCSTPAYYCGSPNQLNFNDEGVEHGFYLHRLFTSPVELPGTAIESTFTHTPERRHYTYRIGPETVAAFSASGELEDIPEAAKDAIIRVRYNCTTEQDKAFNKSELQKKLLAAGAFYVAEILPEDVEEIAGETDVTEHEGPTEALARYIKKLDVSPEETAQLEELAAPLIRKADDGRDADKHTGNFSPLRIEVKNYRSYTEAAFDFSDIRMAMVNGQNGVGKSSLFMDAIADCLYEQTRKEDIGGWVRDGTKSGAITFEFAMGPEEYRVIRTRTKAGRGTLAIHRRNAYTGEWLDESDTTMKLTQARIERVLGMDCNTFCSVALIRQDAYGLFLEASSDRRMEVLSALLGLDIYGRLEDLAKDCASEQRRKIGATRERLSILEEQIATKKEIEEDLAWYDAKIDAGKKEADTLDAAIATAQRSEAMREELAKQWAAKVQEGDRLTAEAVEKRQQAMRLEAQLHDAETLSAAAPAAEAAAKAVEAARATIEETAPEEERLRAITKENAGLERDILTADRAIENHRKNLATAQAIIGQRAAIEQAQAALEELAPRRQAAEQRLAKFQQAHRALVEAKTARDAQLSTAKAEIAQREQRIAFYKKSAAMLDDSGCPTPEAATCKFLADAVLAKKSLGSLETQLEEYRAQARTEYDALTESFGAAKAAYDALGDPAAELEDIAAQEAEHRDLAAAAPKLAAAEAKAAEIEAAIIALETTIAQHSNRITDNENLLPGLREAATRAEAARASLNASKALADTLPQCKAAAATAAALRPQIVTLETEAEQLEQRKAATIVEAAGLKSRIPEEDSNLSSLTARRREVSDELNRLSALRGGTETQLKAIKEAEEQAVTYRSDIAAIAKTLNDYQTLVQAFGLDGIQYMIIRGVVPEIMNRANDILAAMTGGRMAVDIRTEKEQRSTKQVVNSLEVWINTITGGSRPYQSHSGGEKVKIALAVTLGLADVKARRAGVQLGMLFIDEPPFLDADGTEAYADALTNMAARNPGMRILAISHDPTMKARFPQNIVVQGGDDGSSVTME